MCIQSRQGDSILQALPPGHSLPPHLLYGDSLLLPRSLLWAYLRHWLLAPSFPSHWLGWGSGSASLFQGEDVCQCLGFLIGGHKPCCRRPGAGEATWVKCEMQWNRNSPKEKEG